ncbi:MAG: PglZ domain-containing protein, partial [Acidimicrobiales bacterium]
MSRATWLDSRLARVTEPATGLSLVLDPDGIVETDRFETDRFETDRFGGQAVVVAGHWALRTVYEREVRRRAASSGLLVIVFSGPAAAQPIPWDIEMNAACVVTVRLPGPPAVRAALAGLSGEEAERAIAAVADSVEPRIRSAPVTSSAARHASGPSASPDHTVRTGGWAGADPAARLVAAVAGTAPPVAPLTLTEQFRLAARLAVRPRTQVPLSELARPFVLEPALSAILCSSPNWSALQSAWDRFAAGEDTSWAEVFGACRAELAQCFAAGLLRPVATTQALPEWARVGVRPLANHERAEAMLAQWPWPVPPTDAAGWMRVAQWWGELRCLVAGAEIALARRAWDAWSSLDASFFAWLPGHYGAVLTSSAQWPPALHRVAHHLARRIRVQLAERVMLIVLDGLGHAQWAYLGERLGVGVEESGSTFAMIPTWTTVSRQAIFAGELPLAFADTLWTTVAEERRWHAFWASQGLAGVSAVGYHRVDGHFPQDRIEFGSERAVGVVVNAVDDFMHGSELLGDSQLFAN